MRIAILTDGIWPFVIGGMQKHSYYLCKYLARNCINIDLYHTTQDGTPPDLTRAFTDEERIYINSNIVKFPRLSAFPGKYLVASYQYSNRLLAALLKNPPVDLVYVKGLSGLALFNQRHKLEKFPPVVLNVHGYEYFQRTPSIKGFLEQRLLRPFFSFENKRADYIYSYGPPISAIIKNRIGVSAEKIIEVPAAIEKDFGSDTMLPCNSPRKFVFVGRFERRKGIEELFAALKLVDADFNFEMHVIGVLPESFAIDSPKYVFHGELTDSRLIKAVLSSCDVLLCPSYSEGMPNVILEGMACGCAIIATAVGAIPIQVDANNGWLIEPGSQNAIYRAIVDVIRMPDDVLMNKRLSSKARVNKDFLWDITIQTIIKSFAQIIKEKEMRFK